MIFNPKIITYFLSCIIVGSLVLSCNNSVENKSSDSQPIILYVDEICREVIEAEIGVFESQYPKANIRVVYGDENSMLKKIYLDSTRLVILTRPLDSTEVKKLKSQSYSSKSIKMAEDAIVCIAHNKFPLATIHEDSLPGLLSKKNTNNKVFVIVNTQIAHRKYLQKKFKVAEQDLNIYAVSDSSEMYAYLSTHTQAIGLMPLSWANADLKKHDLKILSITNTLGRETMPDPYHLSNASYPLNKGIYLNLKGIMADDATNFVNFCMKEVGQLIVLKSDLLPINMPSRTMELKINQKE